MASCAGRPEERARALYHADQAGADGGTANDAETEATASEDLTAEGWRRVRAILERARPALASGRPERIEALVARWCGVEPTPQKTPDGPAYVCVPEPPLQVENRAFTFEVSPASGGLVAIVSPTITGDEAARIAASARALARRTCKRDPVAATSDTDPNSEIHRCALDDGTVLVVAKISRDLEADLWQVSLALLGAT